MVHDETYVDDVLRQAREYLTYAVARDRGHYQMSLRMQRRERILGVPVIILSTIVGTAIFSTLQSQTVIGWRIATGLLSVLAAVLAAMQTFFDYAAESKRHAEVSDRCAALRRRFHAFNLKHGAGMTTRVAALSDLEALTRELEEVERLAPRVPNNVWKVAYDRAVKTAT